MKSLKIKRLLRGVWYLFAAMIIVSGVICSVGRLMLANLSHYQPTLSHWLSRKLDHPVEFEQLSASWHYFQPQFHLRNLIIYDRLHKRPLMHVKRLDIGVDLWRSFWKRELIPGDVALAGTHLHLRPGKNGQVHVNDLVVLDPNTPIEVLRYRLRHLQSWLLSPGNKSLRDIKITWVGDNLLGKKGVVFSLDALQKHNGQHILFSVKQASDAANLVLEGSALVQGDSLHVSSTSRGKLAFQSQLSHLPKSWLHQFFPQLRLHFNEGELNAWFNWHGVNIDAIQAKLQLKDAELNNKKKKQMLKLANLSAEYVWQKNTPSDVLSCGSPLRCGTLSATANDLVVKAPSMWRDPITFKNEQSVIAWQHQKDGWHVYSPNFSVDADAKKRSEILGQVQLWLPNKKRFPVIDLAAQYHFDISKLKHYMPAAIMTTELSRWFDHAFSSGEINNGSLVMRGPLAQFPFNHREGRFVTEANFSNVMVHYQDHWPSVLLKSGHVQFDTKSMRITSKNAITEDSDVTNVTGTIKNLAKPYLKMDGHIHGDLSNSMQFIHHSPLNKNVGRELRPMQLTGPMNIDLRLGIPLYETKDPITVNGKLHLVKSRIGFPDWFFALDHLNGDVKFTADDLNGKNLTGLLQGVPIVMSMHTKHPAHQTPYTFVNVDGKVKASQLQKKLGWPVLKLLSGETKASATLQLHRVDDPTSDVVRINSDLRGMNIDLPPPFGKKSNSRRPLQMKATIGRGKTSGIAIDYDEQLKATFAISNAKRKLQLLGANIFLGGAPTPIDELDVSPENNDGLHIKGDLQTFDWQEWHDVLAKVSSSNSAKLMSGMYPNVNVNVQLLSFFSHALKNVHIGLISDRTGWLVQVKNDQLVGESFIPKSFPKQAMTVSCRRWYVDDTDKTLALDLLPQDIPPMNMTIQDFRYGDLQLAKVALSVTPEDNVLRINQLLAHAGPMTLRATGHWRVLAKTEITELKGSVKGDNLGAALQKMGLTNNLVGGKGVATFALNWRDALLPPGAGKVNGRIHIDFHDGEIIKLSEQARAKLGFARVLNLLSLQSLPRRLMLDFHDLKQNGFDFSHLQGDFNLHGGNAYSDNIVMEGSNARVQLHGRVGLAAEDYNLKLLITPHVTSSLPVVATIAGGPVAGIATWLAEKIYTGTAEKATTVTYHVTGQWHHPKVVRPKEHLMQS